jgi:hypothetical protein
MTPVGKTQAGDSLRPIASERVTDTNSGDRANDCSRHQGFPILSTEISTSTTPEPLLVAFPEMVPSPYTRMGSPWECAKRRCRQAEGFGSETPNFAAQGLSASMMPG